MYSCMYVYIYIYIYIYTYHFHHRRGLVVVVAVVVERRGVLCITLHYTSNKDNVIMSSNVVVV